MATALASRLRRGAPAMFRGAGWGPGPWTGRCAASEASTSAPEASDASVPASKPRGWDREGAPTKQLCAAIMRRCNTRGQELISAQGIHAVCASVRTALDARRAIKTIEMAWNRRTGWRKWRFQPWLPSAGIPTTLVRQCVEAGAHAEALDALQRLVSLGMARDKEAYHIFMQSAAERKDLDGLIRAYLAMIQNRVQPGADTGRLLGDAFADLGHARLRDVLWEELRVNGVTTEGGDGEGGTAESPAESHSDPVDGAAAAKGQGAGESAGPA